jgi:hypothetical protein
MLISKATMKAIHDYQASLKAGPEGLTAEELREEIGLSERHLRQLIKGGVIRFVGFRQAVNACNRKCNVPVYDLR